MCKRSPKTAPALAALLLAGGESSRMGAAKAWLEWRGQPLLSHLAQIFTEFGARVVVIGAADQKLPPLPAGVLRVDDPPGERGGPLIGLHVGLEALGDAPRAGEVAFLSACDSVFLNPAHLEFLRATLIQHPQIDAILPIDGADPATGRRFAHPLASAVRSAPALTVARSLVAAGERRPAALFHTLATLRVDAKDLPDRRVLLTCNTPEEYAAARADDLREAHSAGI